MSKYYISTSIAYINAQPHIGYLFELVSADVLARYHKLIHDETFFLTGVDEHGIKNQQAAATAGLAVQDYADKMSANFEAMAKQYNINNDFFIRTTDPGHKKLAQDSWQKLNEKGVIKKRSYTGLYCTGCEAFKTEREIVDGNCIIHEKPVEKIQEENYFLILRPETKAKIIDWIKDGAIEPASKNSEILNMLEDFDSVSISRPKERLSWAIPVPGDETQTMYVWTDALLNYLSGIELSSREIADWWPASAQIIGKDIVKFHAVIWPMILLELDYDLPKKLLVHGFINVDGKKMSKSLGNVVSPTDLMEHYSVAGEFAADVVRYLLMRQINFYDDANFTWPEFDAIYNGELANGIGNLLARTIGLSAKNPQISENVKAEMAKFEQFQQDVLGKLPLKDNNFSESLEQANELTKKADEWISSNKAWQGVECDILPINILYRISIVLEPFMPKVSHEIRQQLTELLSRPIFPRIKA